jgi:UDP-2,4-diacetamido-2,4,6-trideoxy-beta-L-altropyranose hydrolase
LKKNNLFIRCDASNKIGLGHLIRCKALAEMLQGKFDITFYCHQIPESYKNDFPYKLVILNNETQFISAINNTCIVVLDGYHFDTEYQKQIKDKKSSLVCIVDLPHCEYYADLLINHSPGALCDDYNAKIDTKFAFGLDYALVRQVFLKQAITHREINQINSVLVAIGGSDSLNLTEKILNIVINHQQYKVIHVITGASYNHYESLQKLIKKDNRIIYSQNLNENQMMEVMMDCELAIVPSSGILFEAIACKMIPLSGYYVDNQFSIYEGFIKLNAIEDCGNFDLNLLNQKLENLVKQVPQLNQPIDGKSSWRILALFENLSYENTSIN